MEKPYEVSRMTLTPTVIYLTRKQMEDLCWELDETTWIEGADIILQSVPNLIFRLAGTIE